MAALLAEANDFFKDVYGLPQTRLATAACDVSHLKFADRTRKRVQTRRVREECSQIKEWRLGLTGNGSRNRQRDGRPMFPMDRLNSFLESIRAFRSFWKSARVVSLATKRDDTWWNLAARVTFAGGPIVDPAKFFPTDYFGVFGTSVSMEEVEGVLHKIVVDSLIPFTDEVVVEASVVAGGSRRPIGWFSPRKLMRSSASQEFGIHGAVYVFSGCGPMMHERITQGELEEVDSALRVTHPFFPDLDNVLWHYVRGRSLRPTESTWVDILAPLPFGMAFEHKYGSDGRLLVEAPDEAFASGLSIVVYFDRMRRAVVAFDDERGEEVTTGIRRRHCDFKWPGSSNEVSFHLYFNNVELDKMTVPRWEAGAGLHAAVDDYFDPAAGVVHDWLFRPSSGRKRKGAGGHGRDSNEFEQGVVKMLNRRGIPAVWYGGKAFGEKPDLAAALSDLSPPTVILGACTTGNPLEDIQKLPDHCAMLSRHLGSEVQIIPVVFTRIDVGKFEIEAARERGVVLAGRKELQEICWRPSAGEVLKYLRELAMRGIDLPPSHVVGS